jgi:RNA polymerase sigma factor (TIGR02999 family)
MTSPPTTPVTQLLAAVRRGDDHAHERLWSAIYNELRGIARHQMADEVSSQSLQPTALVHEAYLRLIGSELPPFDNRSLFFAAAARIMRQIRVDYARKRNSLKRGGGKRPCPLDEEMTAFDENPGEVLAINEALARLEEADPRKAELVTLRYFAGLTLKEIATALGIARRTVDKEWRLARAWLHRELSKGDTTAGERDR